MKTLCSQDETVWWNISQSGGKIPPYVRLPNWQSGDTDTNQVPSFALRANDEWLISFCVTNLAIGARLKKADLYNISPLENVMVTALAGPERELSILVLTTLTQLLRSATMHKPTTPIVEHRTCMGTKFGRRGDSCHRQVQPQRLMHPTGVGDSKLGAVRFEWCRVPMGWCTQHILACLDRSIATHQWEGLLFGLLGVDRCDSGWQTEQGLGPVCSRDRDTPRARIGCWIRNTTRHTRWETVHHILTAQSWPRQKSLRKSAESAQNFHLFLVLPQRLPQRGQWRVSGLFLEPTTSMTFETAGGHSSLYPSGVGKLSSGSKLRSHSLVLRSSSSVKSWVDQQPDGFSRSAVSLNSHSDAIICSSTCCFIYGRDICRGGGATWKKWARSIRPWLGVWAHSARRHTKIEHAQCFFRFRCFHGTEWSCVLVYVFHPLSVLFLQKYTTTWFCSCLFPMTCFVHERSLEFCVFGYFSMKANWSKRFAR